MAQPPTAPTTARTDATFGHRPPERYSTGEATNSTFPVKWLANAANCQRSFLSGTMAAPLVTTFQITSTSTTPSYQAACQPRIAAHIWKLGNIRANAKTAALAEKM